MVKYGVPNLFPDYIYFDSEMEKIIDRYSTPQELANQILKFVNDKEFLVSRTQVIRQFIKKRYEVSHILNEINAFMEKK